ncbi:MAG: divalent-cation tolerance protein CutA [Candidatus Krumholzibacteria bacterium]|nr:divalent-cation tolerance protein CutA [Candidatus Krumholzibacteria bacterium]
MDAGPYQIVIMTAANTSEAERIAEALVNDGLAACVNVIESCRSVYRWQGRLVKESEVLMLAKTRRGRFADLERRVIELHSYDVPEIIAVDLTNVAKGYRGFLEDLLGK